MSLQDKISSAKPTTFLTDGLFEEEVKQAVDEGRKRTDKVKLIIEIPKDYYEALAKTEEIISSQRSGKTFMSVIYSAVANGTPLDDVKEEIEQDMSYDMFDDYGNKTRIHKELWEILDNIGKESEEET